MRIGERIAQHVPWLSRNSRWSRSNVCLN